MAIQSVVRKFYRLQCDGCGTLGPEDFFLSKAIYQSRELGWWRGDKDFCPSCARAAEDDRRMEDAVDLRETCEDALAVGVQ